jgi:hypothetical protein
LCIAITFFCRYHNQSAHFKTCKLSTSSFAKYPRQNEGMPILNSVMAVNDDSITPLSNKSLTSVLQNYIALAVLTLASQTVVALPGNVVARATPQCGSLTSFCINTRKCFCDDFTPPQISCPNAPDFTCNLACTC